MITYKIYNMKKKELLLVFLFFFTLTIFNACNDKKEYVIDEILTPLHDSCIYCGDTSLFTIHHVEQHNTFVVVTPKDSIVCVNCGNYN